MISSLPTPASLLVVRVWLDGPDRSGLRARVTASLDLLDGAERVSTTTDPAVVLDLVRDWLAQIRLAPVSRTEEER